MRLEPLDLDRHSVPLFESYASATDAIWTYLQFGPFEDAASLRAGLEILAARPDWELYVIEVGGRLLGFFAYVRILPAEGSIEIGSIVLVPEIQRTVAATEAQYLMMRQAFELGYRRYEWKCDDLNAPSRRAAERLGFRYEGTFRQATHYKGRNRDTAWYSIIDSEWPGVDAAITAWLSDDNFDVDGRQRSRLQIGIESPTSIG